MTAFDNPNFYLDVDAIRNHGLKRAEVEQVSIEALMATGTVAAVYTHADMLFGASASDGFIGLFQNSFFQSRSPHLMVLPKQYIYFDTRPGGTGHGTAYDHDRHVPVVWMGAGVKTGRYSNPMGPEDIAPTLGKIFGIAYPLEPDSRLLEEAFQ